MALETRFILLRNKSNNNNDNNAQVDWSFVRESNWFTLTALLLTPNLVDITNSNW